MSHFDKHYQLISRNIIYPCKEYNNCNTITDLFLTGNTKSGVETLNLLQPSLYIPRKNIQDKFWNVLEIWSNVLTPEQLAVLMPLIM